MTREATPLGPARSKLEESRSRPAQWAVLGALAGVLFCAAYWWTRFLAEGAPYVYHPDEPAIVRRGLGMLERGDWNPRWFRYPSLVLYLQSVVGALVQSVTSLELPSSAWIGEGAPLGAAPFYVAGRSITVFFALGTTAATFAAARRLSRPLVALCGAVVFVTSSLALRSAVFVTVDMALTFFVAVAAYMMMLAIDTARPASRLALLTGVAAAGGLAAGAKYNGSLVLLVLTGVVLARRSSWKRALLELALLGVTSIIAFLVTTPYAVLDFASFWGVEDGLPAEFIHYKSGHLGADGGQNAVKVVATLWDCVSPLLILAPFGAAAGVLGNRAEGEGARALVLVGVILVLATPVLIARVFFQRNCLPLVPPLIALSCLGAERLIRFASWLVPERGVRHALIASGAIALAAWHAGAAKRMLGPAYRSIDAVDPRTVAIDWALEHIPAGSRVLREAFTPHLHVYRSHIVDNCFAVGELPEKRIFDRYDYVFTSSTMWSAFPDLAATPYGRLFARQPIFESAAPAGVGDWPVVRIHAVFPELPADLERYLVFRISAQEGFGGVEAHGGAKISGDALRALDVRVRRAGQGVLLPELPELPELDATSYLLRMRLRSPAATTLQVYYRTRGAEHYEEQASVRRAIVPGPNQLDLRIARGPLTGRLRLDPGRKRGLYRIEAIELFRLP